MKRKRERLDFWRTYVLACHFSPWDFRLGLEWVPRDLWVGAFLDRRYDGLHVYVALVPTLVVHFHRLRRLRPDPRS